MPVVRVRRPPEGRLARRGLEDHLTHVPLGYRALRGATTTCVHALSHRRAAAGAGARTGRPAVLSYMGDPGTGAGSWRGARGWRSRAAARAGSRRDRRAQRAAADGLRALARRAAARDPPGRSTSPLSRPSPPRARAEPTIVCAAVPAEQPRKRVDLLVAAFALVRRERPDARLLLLRPRDARLTATLASTPGIELVEDDPGVLAPAYSAAWACALPSAGEAFGLVLAESLACGTPVVGSRHGGIPEVIDDPAVGRLFFGRRAGERGGRAA